MSTLLRQLKGESQRQTNMASHGLGKLLGSAADKIAELEKELESSLYFNVDVVRCLSKIAWGRGHEEIPHYMDLAKQCIKSIESKQFKALRSESYEY